MEQPDIQKNGVSSNAGTHNAWIGHKAAGGFDLRSESTMNRAVIAGVSPDSN